MPPALGWRTPLARRARAEEDDARDPQRGRQLRDAGIGAHDALRSSDECDERGEVGRAGEDAALVATRGAGDRDRNRPVGLGAAQEHGAPRARLGPGNSGEVRGRPPALRSSAKVKERGPPSAAIVGAEQLGGLEVEIVRVRRKPDAADEAAPPQRLVLRRAPERAAGALGAARVGEADEARRFRLEHGLVGAAPGALQVDGEIRGGAEPRG